MPEVMTLREFCAFARFTPRQWRKLKSDFPHLLPDHYRVGRRFYVVAASAREWMEHQVQAERARDAARVQE